MLKQSYRPFWNEVSTATLMGQYSPPAPLSLKDSTIKFRLVQHVTNNAQLVEFSLGSRNSGTLVPR